jgi:hypothetical protein
MRRALTIAILTLGTPVIAQDRKKEVAAITAVEPASLVTGGTATLKVRGFKLKEATELRFPKAPGVKAEIKEKKDAGQINALENKITGDTQLLAELTLPADLPAGTLEFTIITPAGEAAGKIPVLPAASAMDEKESNNGFREAQNLEPGKSVRGAIQGEKDVDVYAFSAKAGQKLKITVTGGSTVVMDVSLACYDAGGQFLAACDDAETRDPVLTLTAPAEGPVFLCVSDAHDKGGEWHSYLLTVEETK